MPDLPQSAVYKCVHWRLNIPGLKDPRPKKYRHGALPDPNAPLAKLVSWNYLPIKGEVNLGYNCSWQPTPHRSVKEALKDLESVTGGEAQYCLDTGDLYTSRGTTAPIKVHEVQRQMRELRTRFSEHCAPLTKSTPVRFKVVNGHGYHVGGDYERIVIDNANIRVIEHDPTPEQKALIEQLKEDVEIELLPDPPKQCAEVGDLLNYCKSEGLIEDKELLPDPQESCAGVDDLLDYCKKEGLIEDRESVDGRTSRGLIYPLHPFGGVMRRE